MIITAIKPMKHRNHRSNKFIYGYISVQMNVDDVSCSTFPICRDKQEKIVSK